VADGLDHDESHVYCADQTASALPFFLLALPAGSIGDIDDRRKLILRTELWMLGMAIVLAATTIDPHDDSVVSAFADGAFGD
jgi:MFS family permease